MKENKKTKFYVLKTSITIKFFSLKTKKKKEN